MHYQLERHFSSFDELNSFPHGWDTDFSTTSAAPCSVTLRQCAVPGMMINTARLGAATLQQASTPVGMRTFALPMRLSAPYCWRGLPINETTLMTFPLDRELFSVMGADSEVLTMSIEQDLVDRYLHNLDLDPEAIFRRPHTADLAGRQYATLLGKIDLMTNFMARYGDHAQFPELSRGIQEFLFESMLAPLVAHLDQPHTRRSNATRRVKMAADFILARLDQAITVEEVCNHVGCSRRSLEQGFRQHAGTSPKQFIQVMRLKQCRKALLTAPPKSQVNRIANQHGFWHLGQFAAAYRKLFGETPRQTLRT